MTQKLNVDEMKKLFPKLKKGSQVCIVGAGSVGLYAAKEAVSAGWIPCVYERSSSVGGVWRSGNHWDSLYTNSSHVMMGASDFQFPFTPKAMFPHRSEIVKYMEAYATHFDLFRWVKFRTTVISVRPLKPKDSCTKWHVVVKQSDVDGKVSEKSLVVDAVFCCQGQYSIPKMPRALSSLNRGFTGEICHSHDFSSGKLVKGKRVLVVGLGNSALDVALECVEYGAKNVVVCLRRGVHLLPVVHEDGRPLDTGLMTRSYNYLLPGILRKKRFFDPVRKTTKEFEAAGMPTPGANGQAGLHQRISNLKKRNEWITMLRSKKDIQLYPSGLESCGPEKIVRFFDQSEIEVDYIVACTGYKLVFPFLPKDIVDPILFSYNVPTSGTLPHKDEKDKSIISSVKSTNVQTTSLYKQFMHPRYPTLCFFSLISTLGNEAIVGEMQARWSIAALSGKMPLDLKTIQQGSLRRKKKILKTKPQFPGFVLYVKYMDELATDLGCLPPRLDRPWIWLTDPLLAYTLLFGPVVAAQYRLQGPDTEPLIKKKCREYLLSLPLSKL